jgi:hypothetical protein
VNLFITASFGSLEIKEAAKRLIGQAKNLNVFDQFVTVQESDLHSICPYLDEWYTSKQLMTTPGYGYYAWKSSIAHAAITGHWGDFETIFFLDAGCELLPGNRSKSLIKDLIEKSRKQGLVVFSSQCVEWQYSKPEIWRFFPNSNPKDESDQFMGGIWIISGKLGLEFASLWSGIVSVGPEITNEITDNPPPGFIAPRHDQSIFSLAAKSLGIFPETDRPPFPGNNFVSKLAALRFPIWAARNRSGVSRITPLLRILALLTPPRRRKW